MIAAEQQQPISLHASAVQQLEAVADRMGLSGGMLEMLKTPRREITVNFPVEMDDGSTRIFTGNRVQHSPARGAYKGGIRYAPNVSLDEMRALSMWMSWKCSVVNLPYGGAKGGVIVDPESLSPCELENLTRRYTSELGSSIGPSIDIAAPDMGTNAQIMAWMMDTYSMNQGHTVLSVVTGKPVSMGGSLGRHDAPGRGVFVTTQHLLQAQDLALDGLRVAVQGFGQVGATAARLFAEHGARVVAVSDVNYGYYNPNGLDVEALLRCCNDMGRILERPADADRISNADLLTLECDCLIPAAVENVLTAENAPQIRARFIVEAANGPTTPAADAILNENGVIIVPDILANAGGVVVSYMEWVQDLQSFFWEEDLVNQRLVRIMERACTEVWATAEREGVNLREAAHIVGVRRVADAVTTRGIFP